MNSECISQAIRLEQPCDVVLPPSDTPMKVRIQGGGYGWLDPVLERLFPLSDITGGPCRLLLVSFCGASTGDAMRWAEKKGFQVPCFEHFLAFGGDRRYWQLQAEAPVFFPRSSSLDSVRLPYIGMESPCVSNGRTLYYDWKEKFSHTVRSFLFIPK